MSDKKRLTIREINEVRMLRYCVSTVLRSKHYGLLCDADKYALLQAGYKLINHLKNHS